MIYGNILLSQFSTPIDLHHRADSHDQLPVLLYICQIPFLRRAQFIDHAGDIRISSLKIFHKIILQPAFDDDLIPEDIPAPLLIKIKAQSQILCDG